MKLLAIDSATEACSAALFLDGELHERFEVIGRGHAGRLLRMADELLTEARLTTTDLDAIAFGRGPGGFTGLRIAAGIAQGLAAGSRRRVLPVSNLAAVAAAAKRSGGIDRVLVCMDARMGQVYWAAFNCGGGSPVAVTEERLSYPADVAPPGDVAWYGAGHGFGNYPELAARLAPGLRGFDPSILPRAGEIARIAAIDLAQGRGLDASRALPVYLRDDVVHKRLSSWCHNSSIMSRHADRLRMADTRILVVEDEQPIRDLIAFGLRRVGCDVALAEHSRSALASVGDRRPDLILVDWMLPDMSGLELVRQLRRDVHTRDIPIVMLTARAEEADKVAGLESGADDYITKPFSARELIARIQAVLRRSAPAGQDERVELEGLTLDQAGHRVLAGDKSVSLGPTEYRLLAFLMTHPDRVYSRSQLLDRVWGGNVYVEERTVDVHIRRLRKALEESGYDRFVQTVRGSGYRFSVQQD